MPPRRSPGRRDAAGALAHPHAAAPLPRAGATRLALRHIPMPPRRSPGRRDVSSRSGTSPCRRAAPPAGATWARAQARPVPHPALLAARWGGGPTGPAAPLHRRSGARRRS